MTEKSVFRIHKLVKYIVLTTSQSESELEERKLEKVHSPQGRKLLEGKLMEAFGDELKSLSLDFQEVLIDDLVTAFQNRMSVFVKIQSKQNR